MRRLCICLLLMIAGSFALLPGARAANYTLCIATPARQSTLPALEESSLFLQDLWEAMHLPSSFTPVHMEMPEALAGLEDNHCDIVLGYLTVKTRRAQQYAFSDPYLEAGLGIMVRADTRGIHNREDLHDKTVIVSKGSSAEEYIMNTNKGGIVLALPGYQRCIDALRAGKGDAFVATLPILFIQDREHDPDDTFRVLTEVFEPERFAFGISREDTALQQEINAALQRMKEDGSLAHLHRKWFGPLPLIP